MLSSRRRRPGRARRVDAIAAQTRTPHRHGFTWVSAEGRQLSKTGEWDVVGQQHQILSAKVEPGETVHLEPGSMMYIGRAGRLSSAWSISLWARYGLRPFPYHGGKLIFTCDRGLDILPLVCKLCRSKNCYDSTRPSGM